MGDIFIFLAVESKSEFIMTLLVSWMFLKFAIDLVLLRFRFCKLGIYLIGLILTLLLVLS